jgi:hypothetical protein
MNLPNKSIGKFRGKYYSFRLKPLIPIFLFLISVFLSLNSNGQNADTLKLKSTKKHYDGGIIIGEHRTLRNVYFEVGLSFARGTNSSRFIRESGRKYLASSYSLEYNPWVKVGGPSVSIWKNRSLFIYGLNFNCFGTFIKPYKYIPLFGIRPFLGMGEDCWVISYGYNFFINDPYKSGIMTSVLTHTVSFRYFFNLKKLLK